jgi:hypothetical protein
MATKTSEEIDAERKEGDTWVHMGTGRVYRWSVNLQLWVWTGETVPVPCLGEFP